MIGVVHADAAALGHAAPEHDLRPALLQAAGAVCTIGDHGERGRGLGRAALILDPDRAGARQGVEVASLRERIILSSSFEF